MGSVQLALLLGFATLVLVACEESPDKAAPDVDATIAAAVQATVDANSDATATQAPLPTPIPTPTPEPTPDEATLMNSLLTVELIEKEILPKDSSAGRYSDLIQFTFRYQAVGDIGIRAFTGIMRFEDVFGRHIKSLNLTYDDPLIAGQVVVDRNKTFDPNQFIDEDKKLRNTEFENLVATFQPKSILLADGRQLGSVDQ